MKFSIKRLGLILVISTLLSILLFVFTSNAWVENVSFKHDTPFSFKDKYVYGVYPTDTYGDIMDAAVDSAYLRCRTSNNRETELTDTTTTGARIQIFKYNKVQETSYIVIKGDVSGDGAITSNDYVKIKSYLAQGSGLTNAYLAAADTNEDNIVSSSDYMRVKKHFAGHFDLFPERGEYSEILEYTGPYSEVNGAYGGVDDLGREQLYDTESRKNRTDKQVGVFYFLWQGQHKKQNKNHM